MPWPKGRVRGHGTGVGRPRGSKDKRALYGSITEFAAEILDDPRYVESVKTRALNGTLAPGMETMLYYYRWGRPKDQQSPDMVQLVEDLLQVVLKHAPTQEARSEIKSVLESHAAGANRLRAVA